MGTLLNKIFGGGASKLIDSIGGTIDGLVTSDEERLELKAKIAQQVNQHFIQLMQIQASVINKEAEGNWLQRSWRPVLMLVFGGLLIMRWLGFTTTIPLEVEIELMAIIKLGIGGYVVGRSAEKIVKNVDLGALKKRDRKDHFE